MSDADVQLLKRFVSALQRNQRRESNDACFALIDREGPLGSKWAALANVLQTNGELTAANRAMELLVEQSGGSAEAKFKQAATAAQTGRVEKAWEIMESVPEGVPDAAGNAFIRGTMAINLGRLDLADQYLAKALDANPKLGQAMLALASSKPRAEDDPIVQRIMSAEGMDSAPAAERAQYHFAKGKILVDQNRPGEAFAEIKAGASLAASQRPYDRRSDEREALMARSGYNRQIIENIASEVSVDSSDAIFVTGLPRSGTTLVEQILASHSAVEGGEELGRMEIVQRDLPEPSLAGLRGYLQSGSANELSQLYMHLGRERFGDGLRFVDKALISSRHMGLITSLLPKSPIIWLRRDPLDCAWSAFRTYFVLGLEWTWKLEDIAFHFRLENELFEFWSSLLPDRILTVDYPQLVSDPKTQISRILEFCNLPEEEAVFSPHKTKRVVSTASVMQVREPINTKGIGSAEPYREYLQPFIDAYSGATAN